jgi:MFS family permease
MLGAVFAVYLVGVVTASAVGWAIGRWGRRPFVLGVIALWVGGILLTLIPSLIAIIVGLIICAGCGLMCQAVSTGHITSTATEGRSSAVGLYVTCFYIGGGVGGFLPGLAFSTYGWPSTVAMMIAVLAIMAFIVATFWTPPPAAATSPWRPR